MSMGGKNYYITFVDDFSRYTKVYLLSSKDEDKEKFLIYKAKVENQLDLKIKSVRSRVENMMEFLLRNLVSYLMELFTRLQLPIHPNNMELMSKKIGLLRI